MSETLEESLYYENRKLRAEIEGLELKVAAWKQASDLKAVEIGRLRAALIAVRDDLWVTHGGEIMVGEDDELTPFINRALAGEQEKVG